MFGVDGGHGAVVRSLLEAGANADVISFDGLTAADLAVNHDKPTLQRVVEAFSQKKGLTMLQEKLRESKQREIDHVLIGCDAEQYKVRSSQLVGGSCVYYYIPYLD